MTENLKLKIYEVAMLVGVSYRTIENWYMWKRQNPNHKLAKLLPDFYQDGARQTRYWKYSQIPKLIKFKNSIPHGRNGILGGVTQKYYKKENDKNEEFTVR